MKTSCELDIVIGVDLECGEVDADGSGVADGRCTAHLQLTDGRPDFALCFEAEVLGFVWELGLIDDDEGAVLFVEGEGLHVEDVFGHCMPHFQKNVPPPPQAVPLPRHTGEAKKNGYIDCTRHLVIRGRLGRIITGVVEKN